ncbi:MAG TPA: hypothetical protein VMV49_06085 [Candidatus Deferrimicrobium sp.]|nr:hypothetical protein [Candidatus Deferrimicrobium sp.]
MVRPLKYLLVKEYKDIAPAELPKLPLNAISGIVDKDIPAFKEVGIDNIPQLAEREFSKLMGKGPSDYKINRGISYAIDIIIQANEPKVHEEIMPIDELLDKAYEKTPPKELGDLGTVAIEGVAPGNAGKLKKAGVATNIRELSKAAVSKIKGAGLLDWEAEKFSQFAKWIMKYADENVKKPKLENVEYEVKGNILTFKFDITKEFGKSSTGKTIIVANSHGGKRIPDTELSFGLFAYKYPIKKEVKAKKEIATQNIEQKLDGNIETLTVDITVDLGTSASGKSTIVASSRGNKQIEGTEVYVNLNVYKSKKK